MKKELYKIITQLKEEVTKSSLKQIESIASSILAMSGRVSMLGISRWNDAISYKTIERFFDNKLNWLSMNYGSPPPPVHHSTPKNSHST